MNIVRRSKNPTLVGASGIVVQETENTFKVVTRKDKLKGAAFVDDYQPISSKPSIHLLPCCFYSPLRLQYYQSRDPSLCSPFLCIAAQLPPPFLQLAGLEMMGTAT